MMPTRSFIDCCSSVCKVYGFSAVSPSGGSNGASAIFAAASTSDCPTAGRSARPRTYSAAPSPARRPNTSRSDSELPPSRLDPCMPPEHSPAANRPATLAAAVSGSTSMPPIT